MVVLRPSTLKETQIIIAHRNEDDILFKKYSACYYLNRAIGLVRQVGPPPPFTLISSPL